MKIFVVFLILFLTAVFLPGCLRIAADDLYSLPEVSEEYLRLQEQINAVLGEGAEFSPPASGPNRQAVQLKDIDGNGVNEVVAFFSAPDESALRVYIFQMVEGDYTAVCIIEGVGSSIESVRYVDMDGDGVTEIVIGWQSGAALKYFSIYSVKDFHSALLIGGEYTELTVFDINGDGNEDIVSLRIPSQDTNAMAELYVLMPDGEIVVEEARLSSGIETITGVQTGKLVDGVPAVYIDSEGKFDNGGIVTDICAMQDGKFTNISLKSPGGISEETVRMRLSSSDVNRDDVVKIPISRALKAQSGTAYYAIDWYAFNSTGNIQLALTTYHNNSDEWYLILPPDWRSKVSVRREDGVTGERTMVFSYIAGEDGPYEDFLKVYRLYGDNSTERAKLPNRVVLSSDSSSIYAFELLAPPDSYGISFNEALIIDNFRLIYSDWLSGSI